MRPGFGAAAAPGKKLIIKPLKEPPKLPVNYEEKHWTLVTTSAKSLLLERDFLGSSSGNNGAAGQQQQNFSSEAVCRAVEVLVGLKRQEKLFNELKSYFDTHIQTNLKKVLEMAGDGKSLVRLISSWWMQFCSVATYLMHLFLHLDRGYVFTETPHRSIRSLAIQMFAAAVGESDEAKSSLLNGFLKMVQEEREGNYVDRSQLSSVRDISHAMHQYQVWEEKLLEETRFYYLAEGEKLVDDEQHTSASAYFHHCHRRLQEEKNRARSYLSPKTKPLLEAAVQEALLKAHAPAIIDDNRMNAMFHTVCNYTSALRARGEGGGGMGAPSSSFIGGEDDGGTGGSGGMSPLDSMRLAYYLVRRRNVLLQDHLRSRFKTFVTSSGEALIKAGVSSGAAAAAEDGGLIQQLIGLNEQCETMVSKSFLDNTEFQISQREAFDAVLRTKQNKVAELMAKRFDFLLKETNKKSGGVSEREIEEQLDSALRLVNMHPTKDMFEAFYAKDLAKRLIYQKSASADLERHVISKLRTISGSSVAVKLEGMMKDTLELSPELTDGYSQHIADNNNSSTTLEMGGNKGPEMAIQILTQGYWPSYPKPLPLQIPASIQAIQEKFTRFYAKQHKNRVLQWQYGLSQTTVQAVYPKSRKQFLCNFFQALVLLQFNDETAAEKGLSFKQIIDSTKLEESDTKCSLLALSAGQLKVLTRQSAGGNIQPDEVFRYNPDFTHRLLKIRIPTVAVKEADEEEKETSDRVFQERIYVVDAVIVRIMKSRRTCSHVELLTNVTKQLKFPAQPSDIKKRIEVQIEREYLKRKDNEPSVYEYLA